MDIVSQVTKFKKSSAAYKLLDIEDMEESRTLTRISLKLKEKMDIVNIWKLVHAAELNQPLKFQRKDKKFIIQDTMLQRINIISRKLHAFDLINSPNLHYLSINVIVFVIVLYNE